MRSGAYARCFREPTRDPTWAVASEGHTATGATAGRAAAAHRTGAAAERLLKQLAQEPGRLAAGARTGAERTLGTALGVVGKTGDQEGENGQYHTYADDSCNYHGRLPTIPYE